MRLTPASRKPERVCTMLPLPLVLVLSLLLALVCSAIPWLVRRPLRGWSLAIGLVVGITVGLIAVVRPLPLSLWTGLVVLVVAWGGGLLLGRWLPPHFRPFLLAFLCLSVLDVLLTAGLSASSAARPPTSATSAPLRFGDFLLVLPWGRFETNVVDVLLITALAEHWRRRGASYLIALLPSTLGFLLADGVVLVTRLGILPGIPFFTAGYVLTEGLYRSVSRHSGPSPVSASR
jgi:hypothetical protein